MLAPTVAGDKAADEEAQQGVREGAICGEESEQGEGEPARGCGEKKSKQRSAAVPSTKR